jgi:hypothetical protein
MRDLNRAILEEYIGKPHKLFLYIGDDQLPIMVYIAVPNVIGVLKEQEDILVYQNKLQVSKVAIADPQGIDYTRGQVEMLMKLASGIYCPVSYRPERTTCPKDLKSPESQK